jgi:hypothetical protein
MKNYTAFVLSITTLIAVGFGFSSCKEDEPPAKPKLSFAESAMTVNEDDGVIEVEVVLDKAYSKDLNIEYDLGGTASDQDAVGTADADYEIVGDHGVVTIESGETSGIIEIEIYNDFDFEADETIEISITDTNTADIELTADDEIEVKIANDDEQLHASFSSATMTVNESVGFNVEAQTPVLLEIPVQLDKVANQAVTIKYTIDNQDKAGSAIDSTYGAVEEIPRTYWDYYINGKSGELVIPSGSSSGKIQIQIFSDFVFEGDETIEFTLTGTNAATTNNKMKITIKQQDGKIIALLWDEAYTNVDMDMFLWFGETVDNLDRILASALTPRTTPQEELIFVPSLIKAGAFGLSYVYYEGTANPMNFEAHFIDFAGGTVEAAAEREIFPATYTLSNINAWDKSGVEPKIVQTFTIVDGAFTGISAITVPTSNSRMKSARLPKGLRRNYWQPSQSF